MKIYSNVFTISSPTAIIFFRTRSLSLVSCICLVELAQNKGAKP